jgi:neutral ceramidase
MSIRRLMFLAILALSGGGQALATAAEPAKLVVTSPKPHQIFQRHGTAPGTGYAMVPIEGEVPAGAENVSLIAQRAPLVPNLLFLGEVVQINVKSGKFKGVIRLPAGWHKISLVLAEGDLNDGGKTVAETTIEPVGVGELFVVAGQSYATNTNDEKLKVADSGNPVAAFNTATGQWQVANDPQPAPDGSDGGSIWPPLGDALSKELQVPVGFANVAWGGTSSKQWLPDGTLHPRLAAVGQQLGNCRAVLWQQGESDVIEKTSTETYVENVRTIRDAAFAKWGYSVPWLLAKSTHHPTVYNDPEGEGRIRSAIDALTKLPGFRPGPDTDTLQGENRGDIKSRRHFTGVGQKRAAEMWLAAIKAAFFTSAPVDSLKVGVAEADITPPIGFPMAGYYHERLAEGEIDPLKAKAIAFVGPKTSGALVVCDLIGIATDLKNEVRKRASEKTGIPPENIGISATHSHTAPDYMKELYLRLGNEPQEKLRADYIDKLTGGIVDAIVEAHKSAEPSLIESGSTIQEFPVSFNRRSIMTDGTTRTWIGHDDPRVVRAAGPIDPEIALVTVRNLDGTPRGVLSNFALHLDTVGGAKWSADYPFFIERVLRQSTGSSLISIFGNGCCGDINHVNPKSKVRNTADVIGTSLGNTIDRQLKNPAGLAPLSRSDLVVKSTTIQLALQSADKEEIDKALVILEKARKKEPVDFLDHVTAYKKVMIDGLRHKTPHANTREQITWGLSRSLAGIGETIPVDMTVFALGPDVAIIALPGEVFVDLGLAIKRNSPFKTTLVIELSNCVETIYVPTRAAYAGGSYEVTNSSTMPGSGEMIVETALKLLREAAHELQPQVN